MQTFISRSIPFKKVIQDLAKGFNVPYFQDCEQYRLRLPAEIGEGYIKGVNYHEGIGLMQYDCLFKEDTEIHFVVNSVHPLKFMFCEQGGLFHRFQNETQGHQMKELENVVVASSGYIGHVLRFEANQRVKVNNLEIDRMQFYRSRKCEIKKLEDQLLRLFEDINATQIFYYHGQFSLRSAGIFEALNNFEGNSFLRDLFTHGQLYQMLYIQIAEFNDSLKKENVGIVGSAMLKQELEQIKNAAAWIQDNIDGFVSVRHLARYVGMNSHKLQKGFQLAFGLTVNQYVKEQRLIKAVSLLENTPLAISEIADKVGIRSKSYLSKIFKEKFGITPIQVRRNSY